MTERLKKINQLFDGRTKVYFGLLLFLMFTGSLLELMGIGAIPVFLTTMSDPLVILDWPVLGNLLIHFSIESPNSIFWACSLGLIGIYFIKNAFLSIVHYLKAKFAQDQRVEIGKRLFSSYMNAPYTFHLNRNSSELLRNACVEVRILCLEVLKPLLEICLSVLMILAITIFLFLVEPMVTLILFGTFGLACLVFIKAIHKKAEQFGREEQEQRKVEYQAVNEGLGGVKEAKTSRTESYFINNYLRGSAKTARAHLFQDIANSLSKPVLEFLAISGLIILVMMLRGMGGDVLALVPTLGLFGIAILKLQVYSTQLALNYTMIKYNIYAVDPVYDDIFKFDNEVKELNHDRKLGDLNFKERIRIENLYYQYPGADNPVLKDINFTIGKGEAIGIVGSTGSGKTTLINILLGLLDPASGNIRVDGKVIHRHLSHWQPKIGLIPQHIFLSDQSIRRNVAFGRRDEEIDNKRVIRALEIAQLDDFVQSLSGGLDTIVGENGIRLSGGQRQRLGIARAVYSQPEILIMDEGTSSLDNQTEARVMEAIRSAGQGKTKIIVAHRLTTVKNCDRIFYLKNGNIHSSGTYDELVYNSSEFREMSLEKKESEK